MRMSGIKFRRIHRAAVAKPGLYCRLDFAIVVRIALCYRAKPRLHVLRDGHGCATIPRRHHIAINIEHIPRLRIRIFVSAQVDRIIPNPDLVETDLCQFANRLLDLLQKTHRQISIDIRYLLYLLFAFCIPFL